LQRLKKQLNFRVPGLLIMDTPGHESFTNLRSRGSSLYATLICELIYFRCDIAILVVDLHSGLEKQTRESIELLRKRQTPFVIALNKIDRLYNWKSIPGGPFQDSYAKQDLSVKKEFEERVKHVITQFAELSLNAALYYKV
jgi:translation initiation factor 5B